MDRLMDDGWMDKKLPMKSWKVKYSWFIHFSSSMKIIDLLDSSTNSSLHLQNQKYGIVGQQTHPITKSEYIQQ